MSDTTTHTLPDQELMASAPDPTGSPGRALAAAPQPAPMQPLSPPARKRRNFVLPLLLFAAIGAGGYYGWDYYVQGRFIVSTDDAYVRADMAVIAAKVSGYVAAVPVADNASVKAGDLLTRIDDGDYRLAVDAAQRRIDTQDATIARVREQAGAQRAVIGQAEAQLTAARADGVRAANEFERSTKLIQSGAGTQQRVDVALADRDRTVAAIGAAEAARSAAQANLSVLDAQRTEAEKARAELETSLDKAKRDLSFTEVRAPFNGVVGNRAVQTGQFVQTGTRLLSLVPVESAYVEANFKETQLARMKPGQKVAIRVDALAGQVIEGTLDSFAPASGSQFSLLPPENATGNFTKIVQRVPVRIKVPAKLAAQGVLRPGLSVVADVDTRPPDEPRPTLMGAFGLTPGKR